MGNTSINFQVTDILQWELLVEQFDAIAQRLGFAEIVSIVAVHLNLEARDKLAGSSPWSS